MTSTSQADSAKATSGSEPEKKSTEAKQEARQVPLDALAEARQKARAAEEEAKELRTRLAALEQAEAGKASAQPQSDFSTIAKEVENLKAERQLQKLAGELGLGSQKQSELVAQIIAKSGGELTPAEALEIASKRQPDLFKDRGTPGFDPRTHGSLRPTSGTAPEPKKSRWKENIEYTKKLSGTDKARYANNLIGHAAAKAMGWDHQLLPIPDSNKP